MASIVAPILGGRHDTATHDDNSFDVEHYPQCRHSGCHSHTPGIPRTRRRQTESHRARAAHRRRPTRSDRPVARRGTDATSCATRARSRQWARDLMAERESNFYKDGPQFQCLPSGPAHIRGRHAQDRAEPDRDRGSQRRPHLSADLHGRPKARGRIRCRSGWATPSAAGTATRSSSRATATTTRPGCTAKGLGHTEKLRITERYRRPDFGHMQLDDHVRRSRHVHVAAACSRQLGIRGRRRAARVRLQRGHRGRHEALGRRQDRGRCGQGGQRRLRSILAKYVGTYRGLLARQPRRRSTSRSKTTRWSS